MLIFILLPPLFGFLFSFFFGWQLSFGICILTTSGIFCSFLGALSALYYVSLFNGVYKVTLGKWLVLDSIQVDWSFCIDSLTAIILVIVTFISTLVHLYSIEYMENDPHLARFMGYLSLFTFFMLILVTGNNFLQLFLGWEGVGLSSFLLISFWFTRLQSNKAAIKAMLVNRVGDFFLLFAIFCIVLLFDSLDYEIVFSIIPFFVNYFFNLFGSLITIYNLIALLLFLGAMGKSAQIGLHTWLPDAMEGPTPVSALIHAATMVTAGVFLLIRCSFIFEYAPKILELVVYVGALTAFFAATTGLFQNDIKKVIAYSTCSQLGYMIFACGLSAYDIAAFHLSNHAFFKALLFLGAGSIIHATFNEQDMRKLGGLRSFLPFSYSVLLIGSLALTGFPFLSGFYSKDLILEVAFSKYTDFAFISFLLGSFSAFCTAFYSTRLLFMVFLVESNGNKVVTLNSRESALNIGAPLFILAILSILAGFFSKDFFVGLGTPFWGNSFFIALNNFSQIEAEFIPFLYKMFPLLLSALGFSTAAILYIRSINFFFKTSTYSGGLAFVNFLLKKWYFDKSLNYFCGQLFLDLGYSFSYRNLDRGFLEFLGPSLFSRYILFLHINIHKLDPLFFLQYISYLIIFSLLILLSFFTCFSVSGIIILCFLFISVFFIRH